MKLMLRTPIITIIIPTVIDGNSILMLSNTLVKLIDHRDLHYLYEIIIVPNEWKGFSIPVNAGIKEAKGEYILIMNDDVEILNYGWERIMLEAFKDDIGIVGFYGTNHYDKYSAMWFTMIKKEVFDKIGLLDEELNYFMQDIDFGYRAEKAGYRTEFVKLELNHWHCQTTKRLENVEILKKEAKEKFEEKWGMKIEDFK
jgi:GT2 family glycosyltransferase